MSSPRSRVLWHILVRTGEISSPMSCRIRAGIIIGPQALLTRLNFFESVPTPSLVTLISGIGQTIDPGFILSVEYVTFSTGSVCILPLPLSGVTSLIGTF